MNHHLAENKSDETLQPKSTTGERLNTTLIGLSEESKASHQRAEIMASINAALLQATDEAAILAAVAGYADSQGAAGVLLNYVTADQNAGSADFKPVARWIFNRPIPYRIIDSDEKFHDVIIEIRELALRTPGNIFYIEDIATDERLSADNRADFLLNFPMRSEALLGLYSSGRWQGSLIIMWHQPHHFTDEERYVFGQIVQNLSAVVATRRAYLAEQEAREEATTLYKVSESVNAAKTYDDLLRAVAVLEPQADTLYLYLWENFDFEGANYYEVTAIHDMEGKSPIEPGHHLLKSDFPFSGKIFPERFWFVEDTHSDPRVDATSRASWDALNTRAILMVRLVYGDIRIGSIAFHSAQPRSFSEQKRRLALAIGDLVTAAVERIRLQQNTQALVNAQQEAYFAEQSARQEANLLYQASEAINMATTFSEVIKAIAPLAREIERVYLILWEHLDYRKASYFEMAAGINREGDNRLPIGTRFTEAQFPIAPHVVKARQLAIENIYDHPLVDPVTRAGWEAANARALLLVALVQDQRWYGTLSFESSEPRQYSERDRRLTLAISDLVASAIIRIQAQQETASAHEETAFLYRLAGEINAAMTYQEIVDSVTRLQPDSSGVFMSFFEHLDLNLATYSETVAYSAVSDQLKQYIKSQTPIINSTIEKLRHDRVWVSEDFFTDPRFDETGRDYYSNVPVRAGIVIPLRAGERIWGMMTFYYPHPRVFSERERRVALGIGDLASAAVERIRLQRETTTAKEEAAFLYQLAEQINAATTYQSILDAVVRLMPDCEGVFLNLCENFDFDKARYFDVPVGANVPERFRWIVGTRIPKINFPFAEKIRDQRLVVIEDVENDPRIDHVSRSSWEMIGTRALVAVMFHREERLFGWLLFVRSQPYQFSEHDRRLALGIGDLAKAAVERIHLQQETIVARHRAEILANLNAAFSRAVNEIDLLRAFAPYAESIGAYRVEMAYADHFRTDDVFASYRIALWMNGEYTDYRQPGYQPLHVLSHEYLLGPLWFSHPDQVMYSEDIGSDTRFDLERRAWIKSQFKMGAAVVLPLVHAGEFQGLISINWSVPHIFSEDECYIFERLLQTLPAVIATRRVYLSEQEARTENELLYTVGKDINRAKTDRDVMEAIRQCFPEPLYVAIFMWENYDQNKATYTETVISTDPGLPAGTRLPRDIFDLTNATLGKMQVINDVHAPEWAEDLAAASARRFEIASVAFTNLTENQRVVGVFAVGCKIQRNFADREIRLMSGVSELTGAALERFRLRDETERARQRAHDLAALEERTRLARELHDSVSQALYGIGLGAQTAFRSLDKNPVAVRESIEYVLTLAAAGLAEMRALIFELRPESLETEGLAVALAKQGASIQARHGIEVHIELADEPELVLSTKESLYRVAREALHNVVKHANATRIILRMRCDENGLQLDIIDNGVGFETQKDFPGHLGLHSMRERVMQLGGQISIESKQGDGTRLTVIIPV